jgi:hypothetical protein
LDPAGEFFPVPHAIVTISPNEFVSADGAEFAKSAAAGCRSSAFGTANASGNLQIALATVNCVRRYY